MRHRSDNLDKHFRDKLGDYQKSPSPELWKKLEGKVLEKEGKSKKVVFYYAAASVMLLIFSTCFLVNETGKKALVVQQLERIKPAERLEKKPVEITENPDNRNEISNKETVAGKSILKTTKSKNKKADAVIHEKAQGIKSPEKQTETVAKAENEISNINETAVETESLVVTITIKRGKSAAAEKENTGIKDTRIAKVYTEIMNFKNGEKVDFEKLGINTDNLDLFNRKEKQNSKTQIN